MCGRYAFLKAQDKYLKDRFKLKRVPPDLKSRYNIAPSQDVPAILNESPDSLSMVHWGLIPSWADDPKIGYRMINARAEGIETKASFRKPIRSKRCLIIADSFYEWKQEGKKGKRPFRIMLSDESMFSFAGIWDHWEKEGKKITSCSIITTDSNSLVARIHNRMPVILPEEKEEEWLKSPDLDDVLALLKPYDPKEMKSYEISTLINSLQNNTPEVLEPL